MTPLSWSYKGYRILNFGRSGSSDPTEHFTVFHKTGKGSTHFFKTAPHARQWIDARYLLKRTKQDHKIELDI